MGKPLGIWQETEALLLKDSAARINDISSDIAVFEKENLFYTDSGGNAGFQNKNTEGTENRLHAYAKALTPSDLGDPAFKLAHGIQYPYIIGAMANGITSSKMVIEASRSGCLGFFGAGGLSLNAVNQAIDEIKTELGDLPFGFNMIHSPGDMNHEQAIADLYIEKNVRLVSAAAYMRLNEPIIQYRLTGIHRTASGEVVCPNKIIAKVSRIEVARQFFSPPPEKIVKKLLDTGRITAAEASLAHLVPVAEDLTAEADSGGHTDNRPALALFPTMVALRDEMMEKWQYQNQLRVGLAGGISTPESAAAAFAMGAAYILTGSVNQSCIEAGTSEAVKALLAKTEQADVIMAPAADMFEMGVKVQVLKRGTMFALKGAKLYDYYRTYESVVALPPKIKEELELKFFHNSLEEEWQNTVTFFKERDPRQLERASADPKHKLALLFRSYLGRASLWAIRGIPERAIDYQVWCGPAMGAFNEWVKGTFLEKPENRTVKTVAMNLLVGACVVLRAGSLRQQGVDLPAGSGKHRPMAPTDLEKLLG